MRLRREAGKVAAWLAAAALFGCASPTGTWLYDDGKELLGLKLEDNGKCVIMFGGYIGKVSEGFGGACTYTLANNIVSITGFGPDEKGPMKPLPSETPLQFRIESSGDITILNGTPRVLKRTSK